MTTLAPASARANTTAFPMPLLPPVTIATLPFKAVPFNAMSYLAVCGIASCQPLVDPVADAKRVGDDRECRVHGADRREEARVDDVEVVDFVRLAVDVEDRRRRIGS